MATEIKKGASEPIFSASLVLLIVPAYLYLCSYAYEKGVCNFYGIPSELIRTDLTTNLYYSITLLLAIYFIYYTPHQLAYFIFEKKLKAKPELNPFVNINLILLIVSYGILYIATYPIDWLNSLVVFIIALLIFNFLAYTLYIRIKDELQYQEYNDVVIKMSKEYKISMPILDAPDILNFRSIFIGITERQKGFIILLFCIVYFSYLLGQRDAYKKNTYETSVERKNYVLLRRYGDDLILKDFNPKTNKIGKSLILTKTGNSDLKTFKTVRIGRLVNSN